MAVKADGRKPAEETQDNGSTNGWVDARTVKSNKYPCTMAMGMKQPEVGRNVPDGRG